MKKTNESGRSMVEMLGVLAIIGVLSIGGIAGYTLAMNRYRANEIINAASDVAITAMSANGGTGGDADLSDLGGLDILTLPGITNNSDIKGYANGVVEITINSDYGDVTKIINSLSGGRIMNGTSCAGTSCKVNMAHSVKKK